MKLDLAGDWLPGPKMLSKVATTSAAESGLPLLNLRPGRSVNVQDSLSADAAQDRASCGSIVPDGLAMTS